MPVPFVSNNGSTQIFGAQNFEFRIVDSSFNNNCNVYNIINATNGSSALVITPEGIQVNGTLSATTVTSSNLNYSASNIIVGGSSLNNIASYSNNIGIGTTTPNNLLDVYAFGEVLSYSSTTYSDFTTWTEYTNRIILTSGDDANAKVPDFGFDFIVLGLNVRDITYVTTNSIISFGQGGNWYAHFLDYIENPAVLIGAGDNYMDDVSYTQGTYNSHAAMFLFWNGSALGQPSLLYQWCAVFCDNNDLFIFMKYVHSNANVLFGLAKGDGTWSLELPENNTIPNVSDTAYLLRIIGVPTTIHTNCAMESANLTISNSAKINQLTVQNAATIGSLNVTNSSTIGSLNVTSGTTTNQLNVTDSASISNLNIGHNLNIYGDITSTGNLNLSGNIGTGNITITDFASVSRLNINNTVGIGTTIPLSNVLLHVNGDTYFKTNIGIGTTDPQSAIDIYYKYPLKYSSNTYNDFTTWTEYTNRTLLVNGSDNYAKVPDFGFDFTILDINVRNITYVSTNSLISFGHGASWVSGNINDILNQADIPTIVIGGTVYYYMNDVSYTQGTYNSHSAMFLFWDGYGVYENSYLSKWCAIFCDNNDIFIFMKQVSFYNIYLGVINGDGAWALELPVSNPTITNTSYLIQKDLTPVTTINTNSGIKTRTITITDLVQTSNLIASGSVGIGTISSFSNVMLHVEGNGYFNGNVIATGSITPFGSISDARFKTNVTPIMNGMSQKISMLQPVEYIWNEDIKLINAEKQGQMDCGFIAQDVESIFPLVTEDLTYGTTSLKGLRYDRFIPYMVKAMQEYEERIKTLEAQVQALQLGK